MNQPNEAPEQVLAEARMLYEREQGAFSSIEDMKNMIHRCEQALIPLGESVNYYNEPARLKLFVDLTVVHIQLLQIGFKNKEQFGNAFTLNEYELADWSLRLQALHHIRFQDDDRIRACIVLSLTSGMESFWQRLQQELEHGVKTWTRKS